MKGILLDEMGLQWLDQPCGASCDDISKKAVAYFVRKAKSVKRIPSFVKSDDIENVLSRFNLLSDGNPTLGACLLFSDNPKQFNLGAYVKIGVFNSKDLLVRDECVFGPLVSLPDRVVDILYDKYIPPRYGFGNGSVSRYFIYDYPVDAVRELLVNAISHMDFSKQEPVTIKVYKDEVRIFSFGSLPEGWEVDDLIRPHSSVRRNRTMSEIYYGMGLVENWGQGIPKVLDICKVNGNPDPEFRLTREGLEVIIRPSGSIDGECQDYGRDSVIDGTDRRILQCVMSEPKTTLRGVSDSTGISERLVSIRVAELASRGILTRHGGDEKGVWKVDARSL